MGLSRSHPHSGIIIPHGIKTRTSNTAVETAAEGAISAAITTATEGAKIIPRGIKIT
jgi:hypothetical protein